MKKVYYRISWLIVIILALTGVHTGIVLGNDSSWTQTSQADFEAGTLLQVDTASSPGDVQLAMTGNYIYAFRGNDTKSFWRYDIITDSWSAIADAPDNVETGGAINCGDGNYIYAFQGSDNISFWRYDIAVNSWSTMADAPDDVYRGGALVGDSDSYIYAFQGNDTKSFWRYDISADSWSAMTDAPDNVREGSALTYDGGSYIYAFQGRYTGEFWRYNIAANSWSAMADAPDRVKDGGALIYDGTDYIYAFGGNDTKSFWRYNIAANSWLEMADTPAAVKEGGSLVYDGNYIYAFRGNDTKSFWRYDIATDSWLPAAWTSMADAPAIVKEGGALVYGNGDYFYALQGRDTKSFWRYDIAADSWSAMAVAPATVEAGGALVYGNGDYIYAFRGNDTKSFWRYDINTDWWFTMANAPAIVKEGGSLIYGNDNYIYAFRGRDTKSFWRYDITADSWSVMADTPTTVKQGGSLIYDSDSYIYAFRGNDVKSFWRYDITADSWSAMADAPDNVKGGGALTYDSDNYIYAFRGNDTKSFWKYDITADSWTSMTDAPGNVKDGGALVYDGNDYTYAFRGNDTKSFWRYNITADSWTSTAWTSMADAPASVYNGGALAYHGVSYMDSGKLISQIHDTGASGINWGTMNWSETLNGQTINMKVRTSSYSDMTGATTWDSCPVVTKEQDISSLSSVTDGHQYIQYRSDLSTSDASQTPILHEVTITCNSLQPPAVDAVGLYDSTRLIPVSSMDPQIEYAIKVTATDSNQLSDLSTVRVVLFYDTDGTYNADEVPTTGNSQTSAILTCTVGATPSWNIDPAGGGTTWTIESSHCLQPDLNDTTGDFWFHFKPGKVATETINTAKWHIHALADDGSAASTGYQDNRDINWYGEIVTNTTDIDWDKIATGDFSDSNRVTGISVTYITNGIYDEQVAASSPWNSSSSATVTLNASGTPVTDEFSLKASDSTELSSSQLVTASPNYVTMDDSNTQTDERGDEVTTNTLWLRFASPSADELRSGAIYYRIAR
ncbi:Kelch repeat-containing protein [Chloroflexota bacterium]